MSILLSTRNVQAIIPNETHKVLRDIAYANGIPLRDLIHDVLVDYAKKYSDTKLAESQEKGD